MQKIVYAGAAALLMCACSAGSKNSGSDSAEIAETASQAVTFSPDSAYSYVERQVEFGPRINNTDAHKRTAEWLESELKRHGAQVALQQMKLTDFDGKTLDAVNIIGQYNPDAGERLLLVAHWDTRPWADADPDPANHDKPVTGANDGASGVGVILELARLMGQNNPGRGVDILFVDAEDRGSHEDEDSWALGAQYFVQHPFKENYRPDEVILLDMVGGPRARFHFELFSAQNAPELLQKIWTIAEEAGYGNYFVRQPGGAINDDHIHFLADGIPAIDIIEFDPDSETHFNAAWHTTRDDMTNIDRNTLGAVGQTVANYIFRPAK